MEESYQHDDLLISAKTGQECHQILAMLDDICDRLEHTCDVTYHIPIEQSAMIAKCYEYGKVLTCDYHDNIAELTLKISYVNAQKLQKKYGLSAQVSC